MNKVRLLVLGDMGRSPRMINHCNSFSKNGWEVYFSGYDNSKLPEEILCLPSVHINSVMKPPEFFEKKSSIFFILKTILTSVFLFFHLLLNEWTHILFIQNPPSVPTFVVAYIICKIRRIKVIVDWHNLGYTLVPGDESSYFRRLYKFLELQFSRSRLRPSSICVSKAMKNELLLKWNIKSSVLYDLPLQILNEKNTDDIHDLYMRLKEEFPELEGSSDADTIITHIDSDNIIKYKKDRPKVIVSSCSWTMDDDIDTLYKALIQYNSLVEEIKEKKLPNLLCIITGKGPNKNYFKRIISEQNWTHVKVIMPWLKIEDYPTMLSSADLGLSLHKSSSGLDLPMKVVDMFSVGLPVLALNYKCLHELVCDRVNGRLFGSVDGLLKHLRELLTEAEGEEQLQLYRDNLINKPRYGLWHQHWEDVLLGLVTNLAIDGYDDDFAEGDVCNEMEKDTVKEVK